MTETTWTPLSWTPVRRGLTYCSPACGSGCTVVQHDRATFQANAAVAEMGEGWRTRVWENMGWYWSIKHESGIEVYIRPYLPGAHATWYNHADQGFSGTGDTLRDAVDALIAKVEAEITRLQAFVGAVSNK